MQNIKKSPFIFIISIIVACFLGVIGGYFVFQIIYQNVINNYGLSKINDVKIIFSIIFFCLNFLIILYFWFNGSYDLFSFLWYIKNRKIIKALHNKINSIKIEKNKHKIVLAYCTCDDFNENALLSSMKQDYENFKVVILDDSKSPEYIEKIDNFAKKHKNVSVVRRINKVGFKAGNINNYFLNNKDWDYFVILDSDEVIPSNFITQALKYFYHFKNIGVLQANHRGINALNDFQKTFDTSIISGLTANLTAKNHTSIVTLFGHGAMISKECYQSAGGFPHLVSEDNAFSATILAKGYYVYFAPDIICGEEFPTNYLAFKKRQSKFVSGDMQLFSKSVIQNIFKSKISWFLKFDLLNRFSMIYLLVLFGFLFTLFNISIYYLNEDLFFKSKYFTIVSCFFIIAPWVKEMLIQHKYISFPRFILFLIMSHFLIYSLFYINLKSMFLTIFGKKPTFVVTPKNNTKIDFKAFIKASWFEILLGFALISLIFVNKIFLFNIIFIIGLFSSVVLTILGNSNNLKRVSSIKFEGFANNKFKNKFALNKVVKICKQRGK
ncbi:N-glycosyltransferase [Mycoplasmopsis bovigenitalium]|uniref:N-glycosyltransferase n=1 Tax=Mycoplasmopsis bovigenitalium TaxID=2112 RepID=A0A449A9P8_9BACT|nr:glycosyltransferase family 2 protein [Mycoplasmopsis bovigenitalium]VEU60910.1 N-glycosyltransferase [Mycoplasmopsis bovigenitalium]